MSYLPLLAWAWRHRHDLRRAAPLATAAPSRLLAGQGRDVVTEARVLRALATDDRTRGRAGIELCTVDDGVAVLRLADRNDERAVMLVVRGVDGVRDAEFAGPRAAHDIPAEAFA